MTNRAPRRAVVTGTAGFIGSHLAERLVADGWRVTGVDSFSDYYPRSAKVANLERLVHAPAFDLVEGDLLDDGWQRAFAGADVVFHLAAQAGVRASFGRSFERYARDNLVATQRVLEAAGATGVPRVVWASSSSVYGEAESHPCVEGATATRPRSPYGVTKRACEDLARVYRGRDLAVTGLRYFTVYGPRQRPDMAIRRICEALASGGSFRLHGDGSQSRDFTYVSDAVDATVRCALAEPGADVYNVGGGEQATMAKVIGTLETLSGRTLRVERTPAQRGDVTHTSADVSLARDQLGWSPAVPLRQGLARQYAWVLDRRRDVSPAGVARVTEVVA
jgi:nucleoside-diphosphate-sugar epimerase